MEYNLNYNISAKEQMYFFLRIVLSAAVYIALIIALLFFYNESLDRLMGFVLIGILPVCLVILGFYTLRQGIFVGLIKSNSVLINENQLPEIYKIVLMQSKGLGIKRTPKVYLLQAGGSLNAFAAKFFNQGYVVVFSDLLDAYYEGEKDSIEFVIGHELGHIKRGHFLKEIFLFPSHIFPFLSLAYYRACELTCDNIGHTFNPRGAVSGLVMLAGGKKLSKTINIEEFIRQKKTDNGFWRWFAEKMQSHPSLYRRIEHFYTPEMAFNKPKSTKPSFKYESETIVTDPLIEGTTSQENKEIDDNLSRFMPKA